MAGETGGSGGGGQTTVVGNNIPGGFINSLPGQSPLATTGPQGRSRLSDFGRAMNTGDMQPLGQPLPVADRSQFADVLGEDAQSQGLAQEYDDDQGGDVMDSDDARAEMQERYKLWQQWEEADDLAEPLQQKLVAVTIDGERYRIPVAEAVNGYMMQADYSNKLRDVYRLRDEVLQRDRGIQQFLAGLDDGQSFLNMMAYMGKFKGFAEAAIIYGTQLDAEQKMSPEQREVVGRERAARQRAHELEIQLKQLQQQVAQQQNPQVSRTEQYYINQLNQMLPLATQRLQRQGLEWVPSAFSQSIWEKHWVQMMPRLEGKDLSTQHVVDVFMAAIQEIRQLTKAGHIQAPQPSAASQVPPMSGMSGPVQPTRNGVNGRRNRSERIGDIGRMVHR